MSDQRYLVAARKYRPQRFDEVVAQEHVCDTLKNAIERDRLGHAYLFSGPRGVGKTTVARILAKSINCTTPLAERDGAEPCQQCDSCTTLGEGRSLNVIEIDAASNNKVDDVRELRDTVRVPPQGAKKKVYIIDEVHMLTTSAFNALLKTLEEPPPYALFVFATTEPNKVLPTILSRCQRFDFRRIPVGETVGRLQRIAAEEGITLDEGSLLLIAQKGDGALRDALSVFDQAVALCGTNVDYDSLADALGVVDIEFFFEATEHISAGSAAGALDLVQRVVSSGFDFQEFLAGFGEHVRNLFVALTMPDTALVEASAAVKDRYEKESKNFSQPTLLRLLTITADAESTIRVSTQPRLQLELALLKMVSISATIDLRNVVARIDQLVSSSPAAANVEEETSSREKDTGPATTHVPPGAGAEPRKTGSPRGPRPEAGSSRRPGSRSQPRPEAGSSRQSGLTAESPSEEESAQAVGSPGSATKARERRGGSQGPDQQPGATADHLGAKSTATALTPTGMDPVNPDPRQVIEPILPEDDEASTPDSEAGADPSTQKRKGGPDVIDSPTTSPSGAGVPDLFGPPALAGRAKRNGDANGTIEGSAARSVLDREAGPPDAKAATSESAATKNWLPFVKAVKAERIHVGSLLQHTAPSGLAGHNLLVDVPDDFHKRLLDNQQDFLVRHVRQSICDTISSLRFVVRRSVKPPEGETAEDFDPYDYMQRKRQSNPVVRAIFDDFGGELVW